MKDPDVGFGEAFTEGKLTIEGDLLRALEIAYNSPAVRPSRLRAILQRLFDTNSLSGSRQNIHRHYDLGNDFYKLWLDKEMLYTCAYFPQEFASLEQAQIAKMDHVCRKVWLRPGEYVVEAGCGWGSLALHMARNYGVKVRAFNISREQIAFARDRAKREGLRNQIEFIEDDYRNISGQYDTFMSVGMLEHVGPEHYSELGKVVFRAVGDRGRGLIHSIGRNFDRPMSRWIRKRIFPGAYPPCLRQMMAILEPQNYAVLDVENLRQHYARTLEHWMARFDRSYEAIVSKYGENFARAWRLYLAGSIAAFRVGTLQLFQVVFAGKACKIPWNRAYLYETPSAEQKDKAWIRAIS
jgi:cyclopropane-fatty-acyl-phospholipid synthase